MKSCDRWSARKWNHWINASPARSLLTKLEQENARVQSRSRKFIVRGREDDEVGKPRRRITSAQGDWQGLARNEIEMSTRVCLTGNLEETFPSPLPHLIRSVLTRRVNEPNKKYVFIFSFSFIFLEGACACAHSFASWMIFSRLILKSTCKRSIGI